MHDDERMPYELGEFSVLDVSFASIGSSCVLTLCGELNGTSIPALEAQIDQIGGAECDHVILDVSGLVAVDTVGINVLVGLDSYVHGLGARLIVRGAHGEVAEALVPTSLQLVESVRPRLGRPPLVPSTPLRDEGIAL